MKRTIIKGSFGSDSFVISETFLAIFQSKKLDAGCPDVVEEWVKRIEHDKNNDVDYVIDTYMFGVIENDQERKSRDFHVSFCYRG